MMVPGKSDQRATIMDKLLTRDEFRNQVLKRDNYCCVICGKTAQDAHHILERRLWSDGGYYLNNGASVCASCHFECEKTLITVEQIRQAAKVEKIVPSDFEKDEKYDKWGNLIIGNRRYPGPLFYDENVQKILLEAGILDTFSKYIKYPRTPHFSWSKAAKDDTIITSFDHFIDQEIIITEKMDGENTTLYKDYLHARSLDSRHHPSRAWIKQFWASIATDIPENWRICGENVYAKHTIYYSNLPSYFLGFSIWNKETCLDWDTTLEWFNLLNIHHVPVIFRGKFDLTKIKSLRISNNSEGYVVRLAKEFKFRNFNISVAKCVSQDFQITSHNWQYEQLTPNQLEK